MKGGEAMNMLSSQIKELREAADRLEGYQCGEISRMLHEAADTITSLQNRLQELQSEVNHWRTEQVHAYGNWEDAYKRIVELEANNGTLWHELFGTPERAARMLEESCHLLHGLKVDGWVSCAGCPVYEKDADVDDCCYSELLEWLRGEA